MFAPVFETAGENSRRGCSILCATGARRPAFGRSRAQLIGDHALWRQTLLLQKARQQTLGGLGVAPGLDDLVEYIAFLINRERDYKNDFSVPFKYTPRNVVDFALHPEWVLTTLRHGFPTFGNLTDFATAAASSVGRNYDASFDWDDLSRIRDSWTRKLIVKGVVHAQDADRLARMGVDAIVVSNHGGRQLDCGPATIDALPDVTAAVGKRAEVYLDGGIRRGSDIFKALALGADAVLVGRLALRPRRCWPGRRRSCRRNPQRRTRSHHEALRRDALPTSTSASLCCQNTTHDEMARVASRENAMKLYISVNSPHVRMVRVLLAETGRASEVEEVEVNPRDPSTGF